MSRMLFLALLAVRAFASGGDMVSVTPRHLFVPVGFDDNDEIVAVLEGDLPDSCFKLRDPKVTIDPFRKHIEIDGQSYLGPGICQPVKVPYVVTAKLGELPAGEYTVHAVGIEREEKLVVRRAVVDTKDDYLYAPVEHAEVLMGSGGKLTARLSGRLTSTCLSIKKVNVQWTGKTLQVLPVAELSERDPLGLPCRDSVRRFEERVDLPELPRGWYLLHVRTMNGQSKNEAFTNEW